MRLKFKPNLMILGLGAMIAIIVAIAWAQSASTVSVDPIELVNRCSACHEMSKEVGSWQESSHKDVSCTECHAEPGLRGWVHQKLVDVQMELKAGDIPKDESRISAEVPNERCIACHAKEMPFVMQDLKPFKRDDKAQPAELDKSKLAFLPAAAGHDLHLTMENPLSCTECHKGVSHGPGPAQRVNKVENMHQICLDCHTQEKVTVQVTNSISCSACHQDLSRVAPADHKSNEFRKGHGQAAKTDITSCQQCHLNPGISGKSAMGPHFLTTVSQSQSYAALAPAPPKLPAGSIQPAEGVKDACASCHGLTMPHQKSWLQQHAAGFNEKPELCASCHGTTDQGFNMAYKGTPRTLSTDNPTCTSCHVQPVPHPETWVPKDHPAAAQSKPETCQLCHSANNPVNATAVHASSQFCLDCHLEKTDHPDGWVANHKLAIAAAGGNQNIAGCTQCHTQTVNTCTECHTAGVGKKQEWHPNMWWVSHARYATPKDTSCAKCHEYVQPSCSQCHTKF